MSSQYLTLYNTIYGDYGFKKDPAETADILEKHLEKHLALVDRMGFYR